MTPRARQLLAGATLLLATVGAAWIVWLFFGGPPSIHVSRPPLLDKPAPAFRLKTLDGSALVGLSDYAGRPLVVNFWASWCLPCRQEFPLLAAARTAHRADGLEVIGIVHDDGPQAATQFAQQFGGTWPLLADPDDAAWQAYGGAVVPITFYVDRGGVIRAVSYGAPASGTLEELIAKIL